MTGQAHAQFTAMTEGTQEDRAIIAGHLRDFSRGLPARVLARLSLLDGDYGGFPVDRLEHSRQTATRAHRDGRGEDYAVTALLHDIADTHGVFQGYYYFHRLGMDRDLRENYRGHPHFEACPEFCEKYDQAAFDPAYESAPLDFFVPVVERVFARPKAVGEGAAA